MKEQYSPGDIVKVYLDYQENKILLGEAKLLEFRGFGLPFVIDDNKIDKRLNLVYIAEKWKAIYITSDLMPKNTELDIKIRTLYGIGQMDSMSKEPENTATIADNFAILSGYDISVWTNRVTDSELINEIF